MNGQSFRKWTVSFTIHQYISTKPCNIEKTSLQFDADHYLVTQKKTIPTKRIVQDGLEKIEFFRTQ